MARRAAVMVAAAVPGLVLAGFSLAHPPFLVPATAAAWWQLHIPLVVVFPLLAAPVVLVLRGVPGLLAATARVLGYLYACLYVALDTVSGIAAGVVTERLGGGPAVPALFAVGDPLGHAGVYCLAGAILLAATTLARQSGWRVLPGLVVLLASCWGLLAFHIFPPQGTWAMIGFAAGFALLAMAQPDSERVRIGRLAGP